MISAPQAFHEFMFTGRESSILLTQMRFGPAGRDWIVIKDLAEGSKVQLAITMRGNVMDAWLALAGTGAGKPACQSRYLSGRTPVKSDDASLLDEAPMAY